MRNSPGPSSISNAHEWNMFAKCIMQLLGYQTDTINFATEEFSTQSASRDNSVASPKSSKKMRHSDDVSTLKYHIISTKYLTFHNLRTISNEFAKK